MERNTNETCDQMLCMEATFQIPHFSDLCSSNFLHTNRKRVLFVAPTTISCNNHEKGAVVILDPHIIINH
jgi:hypothetical protein